MFFTLQKPFYDNSIKGIRGSNNVRPKCIMQQSRTRYSLEYQMAIIMAMGPQLKERKSPNFTAMEKYV